MEVVRVEGMGGGGGKVERWGVWCGAVVEGGEWDVVRCGAVVVVVVG